MVQKTVKKAPAKKAAVVKKAPAKKVVAAKKPAPKKVAKVAKPVMEPVVVAPAHECNCGANCTCGCKCGCRACRFIKKLLVILIVFALGFVAAKMCCGGPRVHFNNGCLDVASVKCPKMQAELPMMDANGDGCISREEFRAYKKQMHHQKKSEPSTVQIEVYE